MPVEVSAQGVPVKIRRPLAVFLLSVVTLGIYGAVWYHRVNRELREFGVVHKDQRLEEIRPGTSVLAVTLGSLLVVPLIVSMYRFVGRVRRAEQLGGSRLTSGWLVLILGVAGFALLLPGLAINAYVQTDLNELWRRYAPESEPQEPGRWQRLLAWMRGDERPLRSPPDWFFRPLVGLAYLGVVIGLVLTPVWPLAFVLVVFFGLQVYEDCRSNDLSVFWWPSATASYGPLVFLAYIRNRRESLASRNQAPAEPASMREAAARNLPPAGWYPDPLGEPAVRYWDGTRWTHDLRR